MLPNEVLGLTGVNESRQDTFESGRDQPKKRARNEKELKHERLEHDGKGGKNIGSHETVESGRLIRILDFPSRIGTKEDGVENEWPQAQEECSANRSFAVGIVPADESAPKERRRVGS